MPLMDGTGPIDTGPLAGGQHGRCAGTGARAGRRGGRGHRNMFCATGLTGWQREAQGSASAVETASDSPGLFARLENKLSEVIERLERFEPSKRG